MLIHCPHVYYTPAPLILLARPESQTVEFGSIVVLDCLFDGFPSPSLSWTKDGQLLPDCSQTNPPRVCVENQTSIYLSSAEEEDSGVYVCQAQREDQVLTYAADLTVLPFRSESDSEKDFTLECFQFQVFHLFSFLLRLCLWSAVPC